MTTELCPIIQGHRCKQLWAAVLHDALEPRQAAIGCVPLGGFLHDEVGPWAQSRNIICDAAGVDPDAFFEAVKRRNPKPEPEPEAQPKPRRSGKRSRRALVLDAFPLGATMTVTELSRRSGMPGVDVGQGICAARAYGAVIKNVARQTYHRTQ